jgi:hypothetical protein
LLESGSSDAMIIFVGRIVSAKIAEITNRVFFIPLFMGTKTLL